jgi:hypothetical protein
VLVAIGAYLAYRDVHLVVRALGFLLAGAGVFTLLYMARAVTRARRSVMWPRVEAVVVRSEVVTSTVTNDAGGSVGRSSTTCDPEVSFEYEIAGQRYRSHRIIFVDINYSSEAARATVDRYPVGRRVTAFYDPRNPKVAVLEAGMAGNAGHSYLGFAIGAGFVLIGMAFAYLVPRF